MVTTTPTSLLFKTTASRSTITIIILILLTNLLLRITSHPDTNIIRNFLKVASPSSTTPRYQPTWTSLDKRKTPPWFSAAKFGIFIHWGLYSIPAYAPPGEYSEWYWHHKESTTKTGSEIQKKTREYHRKKYGDDVKYKDFRKQFRARRFDAMEWAGLFERAGARYVVLVAKHHDGFCLWESKEATKSFGMAWNSVEAGPGRDVVMEVSEAVRSKGLKMGLYFSLWDWFNPVWNERLQLVVQKAVDKGRFGGNVTRVNGGLKLAKDGLDRYLSEVMYPQFKELVRKYRPSLLFADGDWFLSYREWKTLPLLSWLFNNAPNKNEVVIDDRWGKVRGEHGSYFTTEYGSGFDSLDIPWEENRGIGQSFGFNRNETLADYSTSQELIFLLVDVVSRGGNLLLNIGPDGDGSIPQVMESRLLDIGKWLAVNGEAIYDTTRWKCDAQWSSGTIPKRGDGNFQTGFSILEITLKPKPGNAVKILWFTRKGNVLYAITPTWPDGKVWISGTIANDETKITMLGSERKPAFKQMPKGLLIDVNDYKMKDRPASGPFTFKIEKAL